MISGNAYILVNTARDETITRVEGYICLVCYILDLFVSHLQTLGNTLVYQSQVKGNENVSPRYRRYCDYVLCKFLSLLLTIFMTGFFFLVLDHLVTFESCTCLIVHAQDCECLHSCIPRLIHNSSKASMSTLDKNVSQA